MSSICCLVSSSLSALRATSSGMPPARATLNAAALPLALDAPVASLSVEPGLVADVLHRGGDEIDRDDVRVAELGTDQREPPREVVAHQLDRGEEVVRTVDLVHLAGLRVADHDRRAVDAPGPRG